MILKLVETARDVGYDVKNLSNEVYSLASEGKAYLYSIEDIAARTKEQSDKLFALEKTITNLFASIQVVIEACDQAFESQRGMSEILTKGLNSIEDSIKLTQVVATTVTKTSTGLAELNETASKIVNIINSIVDISELSESVARNAEIKAFHAGEHGRGFEVVAKELALLARKSKNEAENVPVTIDKIKTQVNELVGATTEMRENLKRVNEDANTIGTNLSEIQKLVKESKGRFEGVKEDLKEQIESKEKLASFKEDLYYFQEHISIMTEMASLVQSSQKAIYDILSSTHENLNTMIDSLLNSMSQSTDEMIVGNSNFLIESSTQFRYQFENSAFSLKQLNDTSINISSEINKEKALVENIKKEIEVVNRATISIDEKHGSIGGSLKDTLNAVKKISASMSDMRILLDGIKERLQNFLGYLSQMNVELKDIRWTKERIGKFGESTKLLSLYGAIEAARSGEFEKDLNVIVNLIRELSSKSNISIAEISKLVDETRSNVVDVLKLTQESLTAADKGIGSVSKVDTFIPQIETSIQSLQLVVEEIKRSIVTQSGHIQNLLSLNAELSQSIEKTETVNRNMMISLKSQLSRFDESSSRFDEINEKLKPIRNIVTLVKRPKIKYRTELPSNPTTFDPSYSGDATSNEVIRNIVEGLVEFGYDTKPIPAIAYEWNISPDGLNWTFKIRKGVKFHDGKELKAEDVKYSMERALKGPNAYFFDIIEGSQDFIKSTTEKLAGVRVIDDYTIEFRLERPYTPFLSNLATAVGGIIPKGGPEESDFSIRPIGAGPFVVKEWIADERIVLEAFDDYYKGHPYIDEIHYLIRNEKKRAVDLFKSRELEHIILSGEDFEEISRDPKYKPYITSNPELNVQYLGFNCTKAPFSNRLVRKALNYALDKENYVRTLLKSSGIAAKGIFPPSLEAYNPDIRGYPYDPALAKELLRKAGYENRLPGTYRLDVRDDKSYIERAEFIKKYFEKVGVAIEINPVSWKELIHLTRTGESSLFIIGWASDNGDPDNFLYPLFHSSNWGEPGNSSFYKNEQVDRLIIEAMEVKSPTHRIRLYQRIEEKIVDDAPWIFLDHGLSSLCYQPYVHGLRLHPLGHIKIGDIWLEV